MASRLDRQEGCAAARSHNCGNSRCEACRPESSGKGSRKQHTPLSRQAQEPLWTALSQAARAIIDRGICEMARGNPGVAAGRTPRAANSSEFRSASRLDRQGPIHRRAEQASPEETIPIAFTGGDAFSCGEAPSPSTVHHYRHDDGCSCRSNPRLDLGPRGFQTRPDRLHRPGACGDKKAPNGRANSGTSSSGAEGRPYLRDERSRDRIHGQTCCIDKNSMAQGRDGSGGVMGMSARAEAQRHFVAGGSRRDGGQDSRPHGNQPRNRPPNLSKIQPGISSPRSRVAVECAGFSERACKTWNRLRYSPRAKNPGEPGPSNGGRGWDRTSDPYDVNVVLSR